MADEVNSCEIVLGEVVEHALSLVVEAEVAGVSVALGPVAKKVGGIARPLAIGT